MDAALVEALIDRDWPDFLAQARRLGLGEPTRSGIRIDIPVRPAGADEDFLAVLVCEDYDAAAPVLNFADPENPSQVGAAHWPNIEGAPMNSVTWNGAQLPIICVIGTRGYHIHSSHVSEAHDKSVWRLPAVASVLHRFLREGTYRGRGIQ